MRDDETRRALEGWVEGDGPLPEADAGDPVPGLLSAARRGLPEMTEAEAAEVLQAVQAQVRAPARHLRPWVLWAATAAAMAAVVVGLTLRAPRPEPPAPTQRVVVKEVFFESVHNGKTVRLEMTVYRTVEGKEQKDVRRPSL